MIENYVLFKQLLGILLFIDLLLYTPQFNIYFGKGFEKESWWNRNYLLLIIYIFWLAASILLIIKRSNILSNLFLFILFRHYFISGRWRSLFRGGGAPGFISHYCILFVLLFDLSVYIDPTLLLAEKVYIIIQYDFAFIMLCSGLYKALVGYFKRNGMEFGLVNPVWGYHYKFFKSMSPNSRYLHFQNVMASSGELLVGFLLLFPSLKLYGALICMISFLYLLPLIRLGRLSFLMIILPILFLPDLGLYMNNYESSLISENYDNRNAFHDSYLYILGTTLAYAYCFFLPFIKITQYFNLFLDIKFSKTWQLVVNKISSFVPIIIWRVFTADITDFFIRIILIDKNNNTESILVDENQTYNYKKWNDISIKHRYLQVTESITIVSLFNTLKYFPSKNFMFKDKLLKYSKTLPQTKNKLIKYDYVKIIKKKSNFIFKSSAHYIVDLSNNTVSEKILDQTFHPRNKALYSPIRESINYGSYEKNS